METVYIETSVVSLLVANPNRDLAIARNQPATREGRHRRRPVFRCVTSDETLVECARGDAEQARLRLEALAALPSLPITADVEHLAAEIMSTRARPATARADAVPLAAASIALADYLLTWNCRHRPTRKLSAESSGRPSVADGICPRFALPSNG
jgi:predicted nucleic acid-binding protein